MNDYCGLLLIKHHANNFLSNLFQLEFDMIGYIVDEEGEIRMVDQFPSVLPFNITTLNALFAETGLTIVYRKIKMDPTRYKELLTTMFNTLEPVSTLIDQFQELSSIGVKFHNRFMVTLEEGIYNNADLLPVYPNIFEPEKCIFTSPGIGRFNRNDLLELCIRFPNFYKKRETRCNQHTITNLLNCYHELIGFFVGDQYRNHENFMEILRKLRSIFQATQSIFSVKVPMISIPSSTRDRVSIMVVDDIFKRTMTELRSIINDLKISLISSHETKFYINKLIHSADIIFDVVGIEGIGEIENNYSQKILCITNTENYKIRYEQSSTSSVKITLAGDGLDNLNEKELCQLLEWIDEHIEIEPHINQLRVHVANRLYSTPN